ncbi:type II 3-dehydroquinate dehydratase [Aerococcaceae bacterium DSM 111022]|nr:type II 3-dehydroquinate dehydratase [Aerococcaceae bacterium DSM 111022]
MKIKIINGPNLNLLGLREPDVYGAETLSDINDYIQSFCDEAEIEVNFSRSNHEGDIIDQIHQAHFDKFDGIVINAGAFTHYSYAIHDAISGIPVPTVEVHLSAIHQREEFRHKSVIAPACIGQISGFGKESYILGILALQNR